MSSVDVSRVMMTSSRDVMTCKSRVRSDSMCTDIMTCQGVDDETFASLSESVTSSMDEEDDVVTSLGAVEIVTESACEGPWTAGHSPPVEIFTASDDEDEDEDESECCNIEDFLINA